MAESLGSRYVLGEALGRGAMGQVFTGSIRSAGEQVAIKVLRPELVSDPEVVARFVQERTILMSIADPNVVRVIDLVIEGDTLAIVMELVHGSDLRRVLQTRRTLPPSEALHLTGQVLRGMAVVHAAGIIHRDIKPENVLVDNSRGRPLLKLTDFGIARLSYGSSLTKVSGVIGTPEYMAPELVEGDRAMPAADVYSAGIVLYEMLAGRTPFAGGHPLAVLRRQADQAPPVIPGVPADLWDVIGWMLAKDPSSRPASAQEAAAALAPLERPAAAWPSLAPWAGPEAGPGTEGPDAWARTVTAPGAGRVSQRHRAGTAPGATVLRHRDHGDAAPPGGFGGPAPWPGADGDWGSQPPRMTAAPSRRKRQARMAVIAVAAAAVLGLVTTVAMAATHRTSALPSTSGGQTTTATSSTSSTAAAASASNTGTHTAAPSPTASAGGTSAGGVSAGDGSGSQASGSGTSGSGVTGGTTGGGSSKTTVSSGGSKTGTSGTGGTGSTGTGSTGTGSTGTGSTGTGSTGTGSTGTGSTGSGSTGSGSGTPSLTPAEQQLANQLNPAIFYDCTARPDLETGASVAALNCSYSGVTLTMRPAIESFAAGNAAAWFHQWTTGFKSGTNCVGGSFVGSWYHGSTTEGQMGCALLAGGILRIVWVLGQVGFIAEGPDPTAVDAWWKSNACALVGGC